MHYLYVMGTDEGHYKIGISATPQKRLKSIQTGSPIPVKLLFMIGCRYEDTAGFFEDVIHQKLFEYGSNGEEWFTVKRERLALALFDLMEEFGTSAENGLAMPIFPADRFR